MAELTEHDYHSSSDDVESHHSNGVTEDEGGAALEKRSTAASGLSVFEQRTQSVVSRIRSREPGQTARFTHPLTHTKTSPEVVVDFEGPDDPYRPINWGFRKKAVTTVLYGLTTMGMSPCDRTMPSKRRHQANYSLLNHCRFNMGELSVSFRSAKLA